jgi:hypothetical protein
MSRYLAPPQHAGLFLGVGRNIPLGVAPNSPQITPDDIPDKRAAGPVLIAQTMVSLPATSPNTNSTLVIVLPNAPRRSISRRYRLPAESTAQVSFHHPGDQRPTVIYREEPSTPAQALVEKNRALEKYLMELSEEYQAVKTVIDEGWTALAAPGAVSGADGGTTAASAASVSSAPTLPCIQEHAPRRGMRGLGPENIQDRYPEAQ